MRGLTTGGRVSRWREEMRRGLRHTPHVTLAVSLLVLVVVNAWWLREQTDSVDAGRLAFAATLPAVPQPGSTTTTATAAARSVPAAAANPAATTTATAAARSVPAAAADLAATTTATAAARSVPAAALQRAAPTASTAAPAVTAASGQDEHAVPPPATVAPPVVPVSLRIGDLGVEADVLQVGVAPDGSLEVPERVSDVGWFRDGARPGQPGSAVVVGHVDAAGQGPGAFFGLRDVAIGARISVLDDHGTAQEFEVVARREYRKANLPVDSLFVRDGPTVLTLITCGGAFDPTTRSYDSNIVVHAVPVAGLPGTEPGK